MEEKTIPWYYSIGKMNDGIEKGKSCIVIGKSAKEIIDYGVKKGVYELAPVFESNGPIIVTYIETGIRVFDSDSFEE